jgi:hypothetical protein
MGFPGAFLRRVYDLPGDRNGAAADDHADRQDGEALANEHFDTIDELVKAQEE